MGRETVSRPVWPERQSGASSVHDNSWFITDRGEHWPVNLITASMFNLPIAHEKMIETAVNVRGWVYVQRGRTTLKINCRPARISDACLAATTRLIFLSKRDITRLEIEAERGAPAYLNRFTSRKFAAYVLDAIAIGRRSGSASSFSAVECRIRPSDVVMIAKAHVAGSQIESLLELGNHLNSIVTQPWLLWRCDEGEIESRCAAASGLYTPFNRQWYANPVGRRASDFSDADYGANTSIGHKRVNATGSALCEVIKAHTVLPDTGPTRLSYVRLLTPIVRPNGERLVLSTARLEMPNANARTLPAQ